MLRTLLRRLTTYPDALRRTVDRLTTDLTEARAELAKLRADESNAAMAAAIGESVIAALHGEPVSDFAESFGPAMEAQNLRTTLDLVRGDNEALWRAVKDACAYLRVTDDDEADWPKLPMAVNRMVKENARLRALAGNLDATPAEAEVLAVVRASPGATAKEIGLAVCTRTHTKTIAEWRAANPDGTPPEWMTRAVDPDNYLVDLGAKPLTGLHKKGLVRREPAGRSFRYWPTENA